ncbi:uncharacterized protein OCT59_027909 [Rhizophagus irregularis]|uniref:uncharacterized protein n=1 Tax=Rhizophagus irregularis TaxID=588596 RepID=UPI003317B425|nr:hypothetical protein OCT59_027909 [Rhizophagus irregularis]
MICHRRVKTHRFPLILGFDREVPRTPPLRFSALQMESRARCSVHRVGDWGYAQKCKYVFMDDIVDISIFPWPEMKTYLE